MMSLIKMFRVDEDNGDDEDAFCGSRVAVVYPCSNMNAVWTADTRLTPLPD